MEVRDYFKHLSIFGPFSAGPTALQGIIQSILLPVLIGALFHNKKAFNPPLTTIIIKHMIIGFGVFEIIKSIWMLWTTPITLTITLAMFFFASATVLAMGFMLNDAHRNIISRNELEFYSNRDSSTNQSNLKNETVILINWVC